MRHLFSRRNITGFFAAATVLLFSATALGASHGFQAGAGIADITPPPGLATGGHGPAGGVARGHLTHLYARAFFFRDTNEHSLLLISVETFAVPQVFRSEIQKRLQTQVRQQFPAEHDFLLPLDAVIVSATHTHQGPGNYLSAEVYNNHGSSVAGFVPDLREFMIRGVLAAALQAFGRATSGPEAHLTLRHGVFPVESLRNRSPVTFMLNSDAKRIMDDFDGVVHRYGGQLASSNKDDCAHSQIDGEQPGDWRIDGCPRLRAVDRVIRILDITKDAEPVASLVFAAVHPTVLPTDTPLFSSDVAGLAMRQLEQQHGGNFIAAFFNGPEGDITTRRIARDLRDLWTQASRFADAVNAAHDPHTIDSAGGIVTRQHFAGPKETLQVGFNMLRLAEKPMGGAAAIGGAEGDRTIFYDLGWRERVTDVFAQRDQGTKLNALKSKLLPIPDQTFLIADDDDFPRALPLGYVRLGAIELVSAPTEMSTATGVAIRKRLNNEDLLVIGLANEYASYTATSEEYAHQDYMAASTLWGQSESDFFVEILHRLQMMKGDLPSDRRPVDAPGGKSALKPYAIGVVRPHVDEDLDLLLRDAAGNPRRDLPWVDWDEAKPADTYGLVPNQTITIVAGNQIIDDDTHGKIAVLLREVRPGGFQRWAAIWLTPLTNQLPAMPLQVLVKSNGKCLRSLPFDPHATGFVGTLLPAECAP